jgi:hypothetical protein
MNDGNAAAVSGYLLIAATGKMYRQGGVRGSAVRVRAKDEDLVV